ncbi:unnamed protein product [Amoebophrya sp. A25]|nr:unnamed protein product [Amoebophrya sp. A25]|eukprot:GSA25T00002231001.1
MHKSRTPSTTTATGASFGVSSSRGHQNGEDEEDSAKAMRAAANLSQFQTGDNDTSSSSDRESTFSSDAGDEEQDRKGQAAVENTSTADETQGHARSKSNIDGGGRSSTSSATFTADVDPSAGSSFSPPARTTRKSQQISTSTSSSASTPGQEHIHRRQIADVRRFYHDLVWLWDSLQRQHEHWILPALPGKNILSSLTDKKKLLARGRWYVWT